MSPALWALWVMGSHEGLKREWRGLNCEGEGLQGSAAQRPWGDGSGRQGGLRATAVSSLHRKGRLRERWMDKALSFAVGIEVGLGVSSGDAAVWGGGLWGEWKWGPSRGRVGQAAGNSVSGERSGFFRK